MGRTAYNESLRIGVGFALIYSHSKMMIDDLNLNESMRLECPWICTSARPTVAESQLTEYTTQYVHWGDQGVTVRRANDCFVEGGMFYNNCLDYVFHNMQSPTRRIPACRRLIRAYSQVAL